MADTEKEKRLKEIKEMAQNRESHQVKDKQDPWKEKAPKKDATFIVGGAPGGWQGR